MRVAGQEKQTKIRRKAAEPLLVYDLQTKLPMGQIVDLSARGMKIMSEEPVAASKVYYCRIPLTRKINDFDEVIFDAECRWCKQNKNTFWYDSGYILRFPRPEYAAIVKEITRNWLMHDSDKGSTGRSKVESKKGGLLQKLFKG
jgi:hypothetical protein